MVVIMVIIHHPTILKDHDDEDYDQDDDEDFGDDQDHDDCDDDAIDNTSPNTP